MKEEMFKEITDKMLETYIVKNHDYGDSVSDTYKKFGMNSFLVRMSDKLNRLINLQIVDTKVKDEKIEDTLMDLANYCILAIIESRLDSKKE